MGPIRRLQVFGLWLVASVSLVSLQAQEPQFEKLTSLHLPNAIRVHPRVISGGLPTDERAFEELESLGVKTVISVDGAVPDVALARKFGIRYVHLPHGYDGIPAERAQELAKALRELEGPIYIHCHHGHHRSPAAAAVGCISAGLIDPRSGIKLLEVAGTSPNYRGLFRSAEQAVAMDPRLLDRLQVDFKERTEVPPVAAAMVAIEHTWNHLQQLSAANWKSLVEHPDIDAAHEALLLYEHFVELLRTADTAQRPEAYRQSLRDARQLAEQLRALLPPTDPPAPSNQASRLAQVMSRLGDNCRVCHAQFRDVPGTN